MWEGKRVYLIGAGKSGLAAARWFCGQGAVVCLNDKKAMELLPTQSQEEILALMKEGVTTALGSDPEPLSWQAAYIVTSPGVPLDLPALLEAAGQGIPVTNEIELAWQISRARIVGVTGSNGKTTVTSLIGQIMEDSAYAPFVGGNIGTPFIQAAPALQESDWAVLELSSFQLAGLLSFRPEVAVFLNLTPDHLDWHKSFENYAAAKWEIARHQGPDGSLVLNYDDPLLRQEGERRLSEGRLYLAGFAQAKEKAKGPALIWFSRKEKPACGVYIDEDGWVKARIGSSGSSGSGGSSVGAEERKIMPAQEFGLPGSHNQENLLAAIGAGLALGIQPEQLRQSAGRFLGIAHRLEAVGEQNGVRYVNDSKATNPDAAIKALDAYDCPILLIAGGDGKNVSFHELAEKIKQKAKLVVLIGKDKEAIKAALLAQGFSAIEFADSLEGAVGICHEAAVGGDVVLLAPACASYDMFTNYEERGDVFKGAVRALWENGSGG